MGAFMMDNNQTLTEDELLEVTIDLGVARKGQLNESFLSMFGSWVKYIMEKTFGKSGQRLPFKVKGRKAEIESFAKALSKERNYIRSIDKFGLNDPRTFKNKYKTQRAVSQFERTTGIQWPFK